MTIEHVLAMVSVSDIERANPWYRLISSRPRAAVGLDTEAECAWRPRSAGFGDGLA
jgi:hypothetical protein